MIVNTTGGNVHLVSTDGKSLTDSLGRKWEREGSMDDNGRAAYVGPQKDLLLLDKYQLMRITSGDMIEPVCVEEIKYYISTMTDAERSALGEFTDQALREIIIESESTGRAVSKILHERARVNAKQEDTYEKPGEAPEKAEETTGYSRPARTRKQEGSVSVALGEVSVLLTPKQLEFMERLSECPGWKENGTNGEYVASEYAMEMSDTMNPMSVGAVLTTLREKHLLQTEKRRVGAIKCCVFQLTDLGVQTYSKLAGGNKNG